MLRSSREKTRKLKARTVVGRGEEGPLCDPGSELLLGGTEGGRESCEDNKRDGKKRKEKSSGHLNM